MANSVEKEGVILVTRCSPFVGFSILSANSKDAGASCTIVTTFVFPKIVRQVVLHSDSVLVLEEDWVSHKRATL